MAYNPNQPRDYHGRWTKSGGITYRQNTPYRELVSLNFFSDRRHTENNGNTYTPDPPRDVYGFADRERLYTEHHVAHAKEMGYKTQREYEAAAIRFWKNGNGKRYAGIDGNFYKYDQEGLSFLVVSSDGYVRTFFIYDKSKFERKRVQLRLHEI